MGTIVVCKRKSGEPAYRARVRIKKDGAVFYTENQVFIGITAALDDLLLMH